MIIYEIIFTGEGNFPLYPGSVSTGFSVLYITCQDAVPVITEFCLKQKYFMLPKERLPYNYG